MRESSQISFTSDKDARALQDALFEKLGGRLSEMRAALEQKEAHVLELEELKVFLSNFAKDPAAWSGGFLAAVGLDTYVKVQPVSRDRVKVRLPQHFYVELSVTEALQLLELQLKFKREELEIQIDQLAELSSYLNLLMEKIGQLAL